MNDDPGPLETPLRGLTAAGWVLAVVSLAVTVGIAWLVGTSLYARAKQEGWQRNLPYVVFLASIPGLLGGVIVYRLGRLLLRRQGIGTERRR